MSVVQASDYLTVAQAAALLQVDPSTIRRWIDQGRLPAYRVGTRQLRLRRADLDRLVVPDPRGSDEAAESSLEVLRRELMTPLTPEERRRGLEILEEAQRKHAELVVRWGGPAEPSSAELLNEIRDERTLQQQ